MKFELARSVEILERTPKVIEALVSGLHKDWVSQNEGGESWSPEVVVAHLVFAEKTNWIPRARIILDKNSDGKFPPFDRFGQFEDSRGKSLIQVVDEFKSLRRESLRQLEEMVVSPHQLDETGIHPEFGRVTLWQLLSTWTVHDLTHLAQILRVMARQYKAEVGPWVANLTILR